VSAPTVKIAVLPLLMLALITLHSPAAPVVQPPDPAALPLHCPVMTTPSTGLWLESCAVMITVARQLAPCALALPSRSPTWMKDGGVAVEVLVGELVAVGVGVGVSVGVQVGVWVGVKVGVYVGVSVGVPVDVPVGEAVALAVGV
jgi:hypothetical protein